MEASEYLIVLIVNSAVFGLFLGLFTASVAPRKSDVID